LEENNLRYNPGVRDITREVYPGVRDITREVYPDERELTLRYTRMREN